jgi:polysaccharide deacetylase 2 family uncharacterized protein YibQ
MNRTVGAGLGTGALVLLLGLAWVRYAAPPIEAPPEAAATGTPAAAAVGVPTDGARADAAPPVPPPAAAPEVPTPPASPVSAAPAEPADPAPRARGRLALVIDDLGWDRRVGERVIALPGPLTLAVLPGTPVGVALSRAAHASGHEVILHQPMAPTGFQDPGPGALTPDLAPGEMLRVLEANLDGLPHLAGVSNHMGSDLTTRADAMAPLMARLADRRLYFLDSRTTAGTVALDAALGQGLRAARRDVFLDAEPDADAVDAALDDALALAEARGHAVAIGHPHEITLRVLEARWAEIAGRVELVPVSTLAAPAGQPTARTAGSGGPSAATAAPVGGR